MNNMWRALNRKEERIQEQMDNGSREGNSKKESERNARSPKHCNTNKECFDGFISRLETTEKLRKDQWA